MVVLLPAVFPTPGSGPGTQQHTVKKLINTGQLEWMNNSKDSPKLPLDGVQRNLGNNDMSNKGDLSPNQRVIRAHTVCLGKRETQAGLPRRTLEPRTGLSQVRLVISGASCPLLAKPLDSVVFPLSVCGW